MEKGFRGLLGICACAMAWSMIEICGMAAELPGPYQTYPLWIFGYSTMFLFASIVMFYIVFKFHDHDRR